MGGVYSFMNKMRLWVARGMEIEAYFADEVSLEVRVLPFNMKATIQ